jgi:dTDP-4-amino-4,6-dideoxygalactose transaminase
VSDAIFAGAISLPSTSGLAEARQDRVIAELGDALRTA